MKFLLVTLFSALACASFAPLYTDRDRLDGSYIVVLKNGVNLRSTVDFLKKDLVFTALGGRVERIYGNVLNGFSAKLGEKALEYIRKLNSVSYVEEDGMVYANTVGSWGLDRVDQRDKTLDDQYNPRGNGNNVHVYVIDTGINPEHEEFEGRAIAEASADYATPLNKSSIDCHGHGTHCAGTVGGKTYGVARNVTLHGIRTLNCRGSGAKSQTIAGMDWVKVNRIDPAVVSMSLGGSPSESQDDALGSLVDSGVVVVVAAGNSDEDACNGSPARAPKAFTVAATEQDNDNRAYYSNFGNCTNIFAPGSSITSAWYDTNSATKTISGTSMATPHVSGAAAVLLGIDSTLSPANVKAMLVDEATEDCVNDPMGSPNKLLYIGV